MRAIDASNVLATAFYQRRPETVGNGPLQPPYAAEPRARVSYQAQWYDGVGQQIAAANYGTNGNGAFTRPETVPSAATTSW